MPTLLSDHLGVPAEALDAAGVLNVFIDLDSLLHVDPHLLSDSEAPEMQEAREAVTKYFEDVITLIENADAKDGPLWDEAKRRLEFKELKGVSLGYSQNNADGSAVGPGLARALADRAYYIIKAGEKNPRIFELVGLFTKDYGPDRISDVVLCIAQSAFAKYTARITAGLGVQAQTFEIRGQSFELPCHERDGKLRPLLFVPKDVLRDLPVALSRSEISGVAQCNAEVRSRLNELFASVADGKRPGKAEMWERVKHDASLVSALVQTYLRARGLPYDFLEDRAAEYGRFLRALEVARRSPLDIRKPGSGWDSDAARRTVLDICEHFKSLVEKNGLWDVLWISKQPEKTLTERAMQKIFFGVALTYLRDGKPDLDVSPETNAGPGPVDFKFSRGAKLKVTVEMKKSTHPRLLHGYETQLVRYNEAERTDESVFLIVRVNDADARINAVLNARDEAIKRGVKAPDIIIVDARPQASASK